MLSGVRCCSRSLLAAATAAKNHHHHHHRSVCSSSAAATSSSSSPVTSSSSSIIVQQQEKKKKDEMLSLAEVEKILNDVKADNVRVIPVPKHRDFADYMVVATGRSAWHVRNIAQALIYQVKEKQRGAKRMVLPSVEGQESGKWIVIDSGALIIHALNEKVRAYYNLERLWTGETSDNEQSEELEKAFVKVRRKNNSKKPSPKTNA